MDTIWVTYPHSTFVSQSECDSAIPYGEGYSKDFLSIEMWAFISLCLQLQPKTTKIAFLHPLLSKLISVACEAVSSRATAQRCSSSIKASMMRCFYTHKICTRLTEERTIAHKEEVTRMLVHISSSVVTSWKELGTYAGKKTQVQSSLLDDQSNMIKEHKMRNFSVRQLLPDFIP